MRLHVFHVLWVQFNSWVFPKLISGKGNQYHSRHSLTKSFLSFGWICSLGRVDYTRSSQSLSVPVLFQKEWKSYQHSLLNSTIFKKKSLEKYKTTWKFFLTSLCVAGLAPNIPPPPQPQAQVDGIGIHQLLQKSRAMHAGPTCRHSLQSRARGHGPKQTHFKPLEKNTF